MHCSFGFKVISPYAPIFLSCPLVSSSCHRFLLPLQFVSCSCSFNPPTMHISCFLHFDASFWHLFQSSFLPQSYQMVHISVSTSFPFKDPLWWDRYWNCSAAIRDGLPTFALLWPNTTQKTGFLRGKGLSLAYSWKGLIHHGRKGMT